MEEEIVFRRDPLNIMVFNSIVNQEYQKKYSFIIYFHQHEVISANPPWRVLLTNSRIALSKWKCESEM